MGNSHALLPAYYETEHGSTLDFLTDVIHRAKLAPYRDELLSLLNAWQEGEARISVPLNRIEELIDADVLEPDVLGCAATTSTTGTTDALAREKERGTLRWRERGHAAG